jgi:hypothetical protein
VVVVNIETRDATLGDHVRVVRREKWFVFDEADEARRVLGTGPR